MRYTIGRLWRRTSPKGTHDVYRRRRSSRCQASIFLSHSGVPKIAGRPELPLVFDAAAKSQGKCLDDFISSDPALQNPLPVVLILFREVAIPWSADIGAMFSLIRLKEVDRPYHRFLWPEEDGTVSTCEMTRVTLGVTCSPYAAIRTTWRAADDAGPYMEEASEAVRRSLYQGGV